MSATPVTAGPSALPDAGISGEHDWRLATPIAAGLELALEARAPRFHTGTPLVRKLAVQVSRQLGLGEQERLAVDVCARVRDIGMISLPDSLLLNTGALSPGEWALIQRHPAVGAELLESLAVMAGTARVVRAHHERWDGDGYPDGLLGEAIPLASRVVTVCDAFVAVATDRPYRAGIGTKAALEHIGRERGAQFDPEIVDCLFVAVTGKRTRAPRTPRGDDGGSTDGSIDRSPAGVDSAPGRRCDLGSAIAEFEVVPAFAPACEQALAAAIVAGSAGRTALVKAIESDIGLTVAVLRRAQASPGRSQIANVADAVAALSREEIEAAIGSIPRAAFPWHTRSEALLVRCRAHAQAVARAAERLAQIVKPFDTEDLIAAALLHDVGKLLLARARPDYVPPTAARYSPEERARQEQRELGIDHASLGGLLLERWGLPEKLVTAVARHHSSGSASQAAALVRLADMIEHHAEGNAIDRRALLRLAADWELPIKALGDVVFDMPQSGGERRRAQPTPLTMRETAVLRLVAGGRRDAQIAEELHLSVSTVRSHLHNIHAKLEVPSRAQAVIRAAEMAWI